MSVITDHFLPPKAPPSKTPNPAYPEASDEHARAEPDPTRGVADKKQGLNSTLAPSVAPATEKLQNQEPRTNHFPTMNCQFPTIPHPPSSLTIIKNSRTYREVGRIFAKEH
jgi:hypothetical protein